MTEPPRPLAGVFFDLDGTLVDSAGDMARALRALCDERGIPTPPRASVRTRVSRGARAVVELALGPDAEALDAAVPRFLELYAATGMADTRAFPGIDPLLCALETRGIAWGVVSNKSMALVARVLAKLGYAQRTRAVVGGDTLAVRKPDPAPVQYACGLAGVVAARSVFVGDDPRDIEAGRAAGLYTVAAAWGYLDGADPRDWRPDAVCRDPDDLSRLLERT